MKKKNGRDTDSMGTNARSETKSGNRQHVEQWKSEAQ